MENLHITSHYLNKARLKQIGKIAFKMIRILTLILYLAINGTMLYLIYSSTKYYSILEKETALNTLEIFAYTLFGPAILFVILFFKKDNRILRVLKIVTQIILLMIAPYVFIIGSLLSLGMPSYTTDPANYNNKEIYVDYLFENEAFSMLPNKLPDYITNVDYLYKYQAIIDDEYLTLEVSWDYQEDEDYQNAKAKMQAYQPINANIEEDGFQMLYAIGKGKEDKQRFSFGYDDVKKRVTYRIYYEWRG